MIRLTADAPWRVVTDGVMGGCSLAETVRLNDQAAPFLRLTGEVSLANNGGFAQVRCDLPPGLGGRGHMRLCARGRGTFAIHLRPRGAARPWHILRAPLAVAPLWDETRVDWAEFAPSDPFMACPRGWQDVLSVGVVAVAPPGPFTLDLAEVAVHGGQ